MMNRSIMVRLLALVTLAAILVVVALDSRFHFDSKLVLLKKQNQSAQRSWNVHYAQAEVHLHSAMRYEPDIARINELITPGHVILSDLATSYYLAAMTPSFVKNTHLHQGRLRSPGWAVFLSKRDYCNLEDKARRDRVIQFFRRQRALAIGQPRLKYIVINRDRQNQNLKLDCLATQHQRIKKALPGLARLIYDGEYLSLFEIELAD